MGKVQQQAKTDVRTPERHDRARDFMRFVAENDADLRRAVRKNVTYDEEVLEDAFAAAVIKVHDSILAGRLVRDYRKYLFIAAKWEYVKLHNRKRRLSAVTVPVDAASGEVDAGAGDEVPEAAELVAELRRRISLRFGRTARMLYELRRGGATFAAIGRDHGINPRVVASMVRQVEEYVTSAPEMVRLKKRYIDAIH